MRIYRKKSRCPWSSELARILGQGRFVTPIHLWTVAYDGQGESRLHRRRDEKISHNFHSLFPILYHSSIAYNQSRTLRILACKSRSIASFTARAPPSVAGYTPSPRPAGRELQHGSVPRPLRARARVQRKFARESVLSVQCSDPGEREQMVNRRA